MTDNTTHWGDCDCPAADVYIVAITGRTGSTAVYPFVEALTTRLSTDSRLMLHPAVATTTQTAAIAKAVGMAEQGKAARTASTTYIIPGLKWKSFPEFQTVLDTGVRLIFKAM